MEIRTVDALRAMGAVLLATGLLAPCGEAPAKEPKPAYVKGPHGAIAVNRNSKAVGYAYDFKSAQDAKREALRQCGEKQCEVAVAFHRGCGAVSGSGKRIATATGVTRDEAETKATRKCGKDCAVVAWACTKEK